MNFLTPEYVRLTCNSGHIEQVFTEALEHARKYQLTVRVEFNGCDLLVFPTMTNANADFNRVYEDWSARREVWCEKEQRRTRVVGQIKEILEAL